MSQPVLWMALPLLTIGSYAVVGRVRFRMAGQAPYQNCLTALIACFGLLLLVPVT
jgi:hypothetical protein